MPEGSLPPQQRNEILALSAGGAFVGAVVGVLAAGALMNSGDDGQSAHNVDGERPAVVAELKPAD